MLQISGRAAIGTPRHQMGLPDLVEQDLGHDGFGQ